MENTDWLADTGFLFGQTEDKEACTGCTVILRKEGAVCGVDIRGGSPVTRDTAALRADCNRNAVHAVLLSGGSSYGLAAANGIMQFLEERGIGRDVGVTVVPNVCAAVLFDLTCGSHTVRPDAQMGYEAARAAFERRPFLCGNHGAGTGAVIGKASGMKQASKGGVGVSIERHGDLYVGALFVVNSVGDIWHNGRILSGARSDDGTEFVDSETAILASYADRPDFFSGNTILGCLFTNAVLDKAKAARIAAHGQNGIARCVRPAHTTYDGDTVFCLSSCQVNADLDAVAILATRAAEAAIIDAVMSAEDWAGFPGVFRKSNHI